MLRTMTAAALALMAAACATPAPLGKAAGAMLLEDHVNGFAMTHCLRAVGGKGLPETEARVLREQADRWGQVLVEHSRGDIFAAFDVLLPAIDTAMASTPMAEVRDDATGGTLPAPLFYCADLLRQPGVMRAMAEARARLAPAYAD